MRAPSFWWRAPGPAAVVLAPAAGLYAVVAGRRLAQDGEPCGIPVVCIGNPTLGGAGKTPAALAIARVVAADGEHPFFLSRGHGGREAGPLQVDPARHRATDVGDEPLLLARAFPTVIARDRPAGARLAVAGGASVVVMDDGFQNPSLAKDLSLLVVDSRRGLGNGRVFPAGPLRAPLEAQFARAQAMLLVGEGRAGTAAAEAAARARLPILTARLEPDAAALAPLRGRRVLAYAGIGDPEKFFATLAAAGIETPRREPFADHHAFTAAEAARLLRLAGAEGLVPVTTEKDAVRLGGTPAHDALRAATHVLPVTMIFDDEAALQALLRPALAAAVPAPLRRAFGAPNE